MTATGILDHSARIEQSLTALNFESFQINKLNYNKNYFFMYFLTAFKTNAFIVISSSKADCLTCL